MAIEQYATYNAIKESHKEAIQLAKEAKAVLKAGMHEAEEEYHAIPPGVEGHTPHYSSLTLHPPYTDDEDDENPRCQAFGSSPRACVIRKFLLLKSSFQTPHVWGCFAVHVVMLGSSDSSPSDFEYLMT